jgi:tetratricopeptide (TPR) repeat protein
MTSKEHFDLGLECVKKNLHHEAIVHFSKVLNEDHTNADALSQRAVCYLNLGQYDLSMSDMNLAIAFDPLYSYRYQTRGYLKARLKDYEGALADYYHAVELDPTDSIAVNNLALAQEQMGWHDKAKANFDKSDILSGLPTAEERATKRRENPPVEPLQQVEESPTSKRKIAGEVFTKKSSFKEFIQFIFNGFKLKKDV